MRQRPLHKKPNTRIFVEGNRTSVRLHETTIIWFDDQEIYLNSGGYETVTTKRRINQVAARYDLPIGVYQKNHHWYVTIALDWDNPIPFYDGMHISRDRSKPHPLEHKPESAEAAPAAEQEYSGHKNRETWNVLLWASNDYDFYQSIRHQHIAMGDFTPATARTYFRNRWGMKTPDGDPLARVHWDDVAAALNEMFAPVAPKAAAA